MRPFDLFLALGIVGLIVASLAGVFADCSHPQIQLLDGVVVDKAETVRQKEVVVTTPGCPTCPGAPPKEEVKVVPEPHYYLTVEAAEGGRPVGLRIGVAAELYGAIKVGMVVKVRLVRGGRFGRECRLPEIVLESTP